VENETRGKEKGDTMLEIIGVLGGLFGFLVYAMVRTQLARRRAEAEQKADAVVQPHQTEVR
jgi:hypothetical protein